MSDEQTIIDLLTENKLLRFVLCKVVLNVMDNLPVDKMTDPLVIAIDEAGDLLSDINDIDYEGARLGVKETEE
jgi:hypothetical protein